MAATQPENPDLSLVRTLALFRRQKDPLAKARYDQVTAVSVAMIVASAGTCADSKPSNR